MSAIEEFIRENREMFHMQEPPEGHFDRFEEKLARMRRFERNRLVARITGIAASAVILVASSVFVFDRFIDRDPVMLNLGDLNPQMQKVEYYFTSRIDGLSAGLDSLSSAADPTVRQMITNELAEMDSLHRELKIRLGSNPSDDRVINAMIAYYQSKLGMMQSFLDNLNQIRQSNNSKKDNNESTLF